MSEVNNNNDKMAAKYGPPLVRRIVNTPLGPKPVGPYNQAVCFDRTLYVSGCLGIDVKSSKLVEGGAAAEARKALENLGHILQAGGSRFENVIKSTVFLNDIADFGAVNEVYKQYFKSAFPARSSFQVGKLPLGANVEIEVVAAVGEVIQEEANS